MPDLCVQFIFCDTTTLFLYEVTKEDQSPSLPCKSGSTW